MDSSLPPRTANSSARSPNVVNTSVGCFVEVIMIMADMVDFDRGQNKCVCDVSLFHDGPFVPTQTNQIGQVRRIQEERSTRMHSLQAPRRLWRTPEYVSTFPAGLELMVRIR